ncbi:MAG: ABC transporter permease [Deltaproteobacteria bacterium]|nr:ABC transporter permease [Deltaproteobacteria bacterium]
MNQKTNNWNKFIANYGLLFAFIVAIIVFSFWSGHFLSWGNIQNILVQTTSLGVCAFGLTLIMMMGEIDLSYAGLTGLIGAVMLKMIMAGYSPIWVVLVCLAIGVVSGLCIAILVVGLGMSSFMVTLAAWFIYMGLERYIGHGVTHWIYKYDESILQIVQGHLGPLPIPIIVMLGLFLLCWLFQTRTRTGQYILALGENIEAVKEVGLKAKLIKGGTFVAAGLIFGLTGLIETLRIGGSMVYSGRFLLVYALGAVFLGSAAFKAGKYNFPGTLLGALFFYTIINGLTLNAVKFYYIPLVQGLFLILAVAITTVKRGEIEQVQF